MIAITHAAFEPAGHPRATAQTEALCKTGPRQAALALCSCAEPPAFDAGHPASILETT